jgi:hypothetical protein
MDQEVTNQVVQHTGDAVMAKTATGMTVGGGAAAVYGGWTLNEWAIVFGMIVGLLGLVLQVYQTIHKRALYVEEKKLIRERARREEEEHAAKMEMYR